MKKQAILNLIKYHFEDNEDAFVNETLEIAKEFRKIHDDLTAEYIIDTITPNHYYVPQSISRNYRFLKEKEYENRNIYLPEAIREDVIGIAKAIEKNSDVNKFLFYGSPGTGKTESAYQIARMTNRKLLYVAAEELVDSKLGETSKNISLLFNEIQSLYSKEVIVLFDEIDSLILDRINNNDVREMGRATSVFLKELDNLKNNVTIIATTNLVNNFDKAILRRFDSMISFDRYDRDDLIDISLNIMNERLKKVGESKKDSRLFKKIVENAKKIPNPGDLSQMIKTSIAFADEDKEYDYLRKFYNQINGVCNEKDIEKLKEEGYSFREIEIITKTPKSSVSRKLKNNK